MYRKRGKIMKKDRFMIAGISSGSGKTLITCGLLALLKKNGHRLASFKCGPDYIDPMFHTDVLGTRSRNLDLFFTDPVMTRFLFKKNSADADLAVIEGVMGYYDGMGVDTAAAGASDLAAATKTPVFLIVPAKGVSLSILPLIKGFLDFQKEPCIRGIILNRVSKGMYPRMKKMIEEQLHIPVVGYAPQMDDLTLESRHLGLLLPSEIKDLRQKLDRMADVFSETMDLDKILELAGEAPELPEEELTDPVIQKLEEERKEAGSSADERTFRLRIGLAKDEAFCFFYQDNLDLLRELGAEIVEFSPLKDHELPENLDGLILNGGYPELHVKELSDNLSMRISIAKAVEQGLPTIAECGGFLYLHDSLQNMEGDLYPMAGNIEGRGSWTGHLTRFGYATLTDGTMFGQNVGDVRTHEFHYYDSDNLGEAFLAKKPTGNRSWRCIHSTNTLYAGFPHLYFYANPKVALSFLIACAKRKTSAS